MTWRISLQKCLEGRKAVGMAWIACGFAGGMSVMPSNVPLLFLSHQGNPELYKSLRLPIKGGRSATVKGDEKLLY